MVFNPNSAIWSERFRPNKVADIVGDFTDKIQKYIENPMAIQNFLFYSKSPGCGKTTLAKAIINELGCDSLTINSSDDRGIETIREKVKQFALTKSSVEGVKRCVFLDEIDGANQFFQNALRNIIESYASNVFFILTANSINKVNEPLRSRCLEIQFSYPNKEDIFKYLEKICNAEEMDYSKEGLQMVIEMNYPNIRNCVLTLQDLFTEGKEVFTENIKPVNKVFDDIYQMIQDKKWQEVKHIILSSSIEERELNTFLWNKAVATDNIRLIQLTCRNERDIALGANPKIIVTSSITELMK